MAFKELARAKVKDDGTLDLTEKQAANIKKEYHRLGGKDKDFDPRNLKVKP